MPASCQNVGEVADYWLSALLKAFPSIQSNNMFYVLYKNYATGSTTLSTLATWLNGEEFRTRNTKKLPDAKGELVAEPRLFTTASVRGILHNPTYTGKVRHKDQLYPGLHDPLVSEELFQVVQDILKKNSGRSETLQARPTREYLLKGLVRCAYCRMPMWAQTYRNGNRYYREQHGSRGAGNCVNKSGSIRCEVPDEQMGMIIGAIILPDSWMDRLLAKIQLADEVKRVNRERKKVETRLKKLGQVYLDDDNMDHEDYNSERRSWRTSFRPFRCPRWTQSKRRVSYWRNCPSYGRGPIWRIGVES
ncbi:MAG: recombinase family protein [Chloroflexi bacterium]|nr:recombinase family protein [Chloroflexota bacterium]